ncbi:uncharacterized protein LOC135846026 [Planococcus citri]|uniref:uncharacterized protein LOC135846026 n=1 Tax=Planococcus citri TaxID=170843 RepID=UPI0031F89C1C
MCTVNFKSTYYNDIPMKKIFFLFIISATALQIIHCIIQWKDVSHTLHWEYTLDKFKSEKDSIADFYDSVAQVVEKGNESVWIRVNAYKNDSSLVYKCGEYLLSRYQELSSKNASIFTEDEKTLIRTEYRFLCASMIMIDSWHHWIDLQGGSIISAIFKAAGGDVVEAIGEKSMNKPLNQITYP